MSDNTDNTDFEKLYRNVDELDHLLDQKDVEYVQKLSELDDVEIGLVFDPVCAVGGGYRDDEITICDIIPHGAKNSFVIYKRGDGRYTQINNLDLDEYEDLIKDIQSIVPL
jgi:hypothetical protein